MIVRIANQQDKDQVLKLFDEFSRFFNASDTPSEIGGEIYDEVIRREDTMIFVAEESNQLIGLATFYILPNIRHGWHRGHVEDFFITDSMRGKGVGTKIFDAMKEYCREKNIKVIKLDSAIELEETHAFYEKNGGKFTEKMFRFDIK